MNRWLGTALLIMALLLAVGGALRPDPRAAAREPDAPGGPRARPEVGYPAPDFELPTLEGGTVRLSDLRGKVVFINFWASWCPPCRAEMPEIAKLRAEGIPDLVILGVDLTHTEPSVETVRSFMGDNGYDWPVALDVRGEVTSAYRVVSIPTSYFIGPDGVITAKHVGTLTLPAMQDLVRQARRGG